MQLRFSHVACIVWRTGPGERDQEASPQHAGTASWPPGQGRLSSGRGIPGKSRLGCGMDSALGNTLDLPGKQVGHGGGSLCSQSHSYKLVLVSSSPCVPLPS